MDAKTIAYAQSIYRVLKGRKFEDIDDSDDGTDYVESVRDFTNMYLDELENVANVNGGPITWWFTRDNGHEIGTATIGESSIDFPSDISQLTADEERYVQVIQDGTVVSNWVVVNPKDISSRTDRIVRDMCAVVGTSIVFSRAFKDYEDGGTVIGDVSLALPRMTATNTKVLDIVKPKQLLILGCAKMIILPDIVQGDLAPSYQTNYDKLLDGAIARSNATGAAHTVVHESFGYIGGV